METNKKAMSFLKSNRFESCQLTLKLAENKLKKYEDSQEFIENNAYFNAASITYNNLG